MHICNSMKWVYYSKDKSYSQPKQNAKWKDGENCVAKENYIQFPKRNMGNGIKDTLCHGHYIMVKRPFQRVFLWWGQMQCQPICKAK